MGSCSSSPGVWTSESLRARLASGFLASLPPAEMLPGNVIKVGGLEGYFNPVPPLNPSWLAGRMTPDEFVSFLHSVNEVVIASHVGRSKGAAVYYQGHLASDPNPVQRASTAIRAWLQQIAAPWWLQHRGLNIAYVLEPEQPGYRTFPCHLLIAIQDQAPARAEGSSESAPPVFPPK